MYCVIFIFLSVLSLLLKTESQLKINNQLVTMHSDSAIEFYNRKETWVPLCMQMACTTLDCVLNTSEVVDIHPPTLTTAHAHNP
jgi:hypothetical protein